MEWMINTQLGRRNLPPAQRLAVMDKFKRKIQEQAKENMSEGGRDKNRIIIKIGFLQMEKSVLVKGFIQIKKLQKWQVCELELLQDLIK